jgi:hypothetical protein
MLRRGSIWRREEAMVYIGPRLWPGESLEEDDGFNGAVLESAIYLVAMP